MSRHSGRTFAALASLATLIFALAAPAPARAADLRWHGLLDLVGSELTHDYVENVLTRGDNPYDAYRAQLFVESQVDEHIQAIGQFVLTDATDIYVDGAYAIVTPWANRDAHLMLGKIPWAIGTWGPRTYSNKNPLIAPPLLYQHPTTLLWFDLPPTLDALLATAGRGARGVNYAGYSEGIGMPVVDDSYWDVGITLNGSARPIEYSFGVTAGAPSWGSTSKDDNSGKTVLGRLGLAPIPSLRFGVSGAMGPYLGAFLNRDMPPGRNVNDYKQKLLMADFELQIAHVELRAEGARNWWETPIAGELGVTTGYGELKYLLPAGWYAAGRWDVERFSKVMGSSGVPRPWDWDVTRLDGGLGYRVTRDATAKLVYQRTRFDTGVAGSHRDDQSLFAGQLSLAF